jgi:hypothetical protein
MNLTGEQIERLRPGFEAWWRSNKFVEHLIVRSGCDEYQFPAQGMFLAYCAHASAMLGDESVERAAVQLFAEQGRSRYCLEEVAKAIKAAVEN